MRLAPKMVGMPTTFVNATVVLIRLIKKSMRSVTISSITPQSPQLAWKKVGTPTTRANATVAVIQLIKKSMRSVTI